MGRLDVLRIRASMSRSNHWLIALAPPAARYPPIIVHTTVGPSGHPRSAMIMVSSVVKSSSEITRGLVRRT